MKKRAVFTLVAVVVLSFTLAGCAKKCKSEGCNENVVKNTDYCTDPMHQLEGALNGIDINSLIQ